MKRNNVMINKKTFCSKESKIALKTHLSPSLLSMTDKCSIQGGKSVSIYLDALFGKIILRSIKTRQRNGHKLCLFMHCNCYARQSATKNVFLQGHRQLQTAKGIPYRAIIKKKYILLSKWCRNSWRLFTERHFLAKNVMLNMSAIPTNTILNVHETPSKA